ncbi:MAG: hypothetical protein ACYDD4_09420 [Acidimicrobiales bacterium]
MRMRLAAAALITTGLAGAATLGLAGAASADASSASQIAGYTASSEAIGAQFALNVPNLVPLPGNLVEDDIPFARTTVQSGPIVDSIGAPYYPGDILANAGGLESEFFPPQLPNTPWPFMARAQYPTTGYGPHATFGGTPPSQLSSSPLQPSVLAGEADANVNGGDSTGSVTDIVVGPGMGQGGAALLEIGSITSSQSVSQTASLVTATAQSVVKAVNIAGMVDISALTSKAVSSSDGTTGTPTATLTIGSVTVDGESAYIDGTGVHVVGNSAPGPGVPTVSQLQASLNSTLEQDGITVRLLDPEQTVNGAEGIANAGGLEIGLDHAFNVPFVDTGTLTGNKVEPCVATQNIIPGQAILGDACLPAGAYEATTSITLGLASTDVNATAFAPSSTVVDTGGSFTDLGGGLGGGLSTGSTGGSLGIGALSGGGTTLGTVSGAGTTTAASGFNPGLLRFPIRGVPAPVGWIVIGMILCVIFAWPMMLAARWQFLVGRR